MAFEGRFQIYTGNGKGKTTAALGLAVRAACAGLRVYIGQFMKGRDCAELSLPEYFPRRIVIEQYGDAALIGKGEEPSQEDISLAVDGLSRLAAAMLSGDFQVVVADELNVAVHMGLVSRDSALDLVRARPHDVELILTGRYAPESLIEVADLVTEMVEKKHYYATENLQARKGIEA